MYDLSLRSNFMADEELKTTSLKQRKCFGLKEAAGNAFVWIDFRAAEMVAADRVHTAGSGAGPVILDDGMIRADILAAAAAQAFVAVDMRAPVYKRHGFCRADAHARVRQAGAAVVAYDKALRVARVACKGNDIDEGRFIYIAHFLALFNTARDRRRIVRCAQRQPQRKAQALTDDCPLFKYAFTVSR